MQENLISDSNPNPNDSDAPKVIPECVKQYGYVNQDPYTSANWISRLFFYWAYRIIKLANMTTIKASYLGKLMGNYTSKIYLQDIKYVWEERKYRFKKHIPLIRAGFRANWFYVLIVWLFCLIRSGINIFQMSLFREYMKMFREKTEEERQNVSFLGQFSQVQIGVLYLTIKFWEIFFLRKSFEYQSFWGYKSGVEFNCIIFDKLWKVSPASMKDRARSGEVMNFMQIDSHKLTMLMLMSPDLITVPLMIVSYSYMLFQYFGISFIFGLATLIFFLLSNFYFQRKFKVLQKEQMKLKDKRMKIVTETFNNLKMLKLYSWEDEFLNRILEARENEIFNLEKRFKISNVNQSLGWLTPVATSIVSWGAYQYFNDYIKIEDIFTCWGIFTSIQHPLRMLPMILNNFFETTISMKRIENYWNEEEINENNLIKNDKETTEQGWSIKIENGDFTWGAPVKEETEGLRVRKKGIWQETAFKKENVKDVIKEIPSSYGPVEWSSTVSMSNSSLPSRYSNISSDSTSSMNSDTTPILPELNTCISNPNSSCSSSSSIDPVRPILRNINLEIKKGEFVCIIGEVGCGKSSLLQAILNNMLPISNKSKIFLNGTVSYVSQSAWIQNATVKNNILFYQPFDEERYKKVIEWSEWKPDWDIWVGGDWTEIGEKGINLSGGQKARISLARAWYAEKDIYIWDDPISALDAHVGMNVMNNCVIKYLKNKTRILVTHALQYVSYADRILYMKDGEISWQGTYSEIKEQEFFQNFYEKMKNINRRKSSDEKDKSKTDKKGTPWSELDDADRIPNNGTVKRITKDEDKEEGRVQALVYKAYIMYLGGMIVIIMYSLILIAMQSFKGSSDLWWGYWTDHQSKENNMFYFGIYALLGLTGCLFNYFKIKLNSNCSIRLSRQWFNQMITSLIRAPISTFHETIPKGQIFNRLSKEINNWDIFCMRMFGELMTSLTSFLASILICSIYQPYCWLFLPFLSVIGYKLVLYYVSCSRELNRWEGVIRSPVMNLLNETIPGTTTIRAYNYEKKYLEMFHDRIDAHWNIRIILNGISQWFDLMWDWLSFSFIAFWIGFTIYFRKDFEPKVIGILITYCMSLQMSLIHGWHTTAAFENSMVGLERCLKYTECPTEMPKNTAIDSILATWPSEGKIKFVDYSVKYRPDTEIVLKNLNFEITKHEKIGIVGRTGSGKSTISLCLFRLLEPLNGKILIDNVDINTIGLDKLRSCLTIIPQDPSWMEGTWRYNIDPLNKYSNSDIINVMKKIGFDYIISQNDQGINQAISEGGTNWSVGEKQLICITRAILRKSKIIIMDEATASIDYQTEEIIQKAINEIWCDSTVITIAHRIKTILNCDRVITLDNGNILDFDKPKVLWENKKEFFMNCTPSQHCSSLSPWNEKR